VLENIELITPQGWVAFGLVNFKVRDYFSLSLLLTPALKIVMSEALAQMVSEI